MFLPLRQALLSMTLEIGGQAMSHSACRDLEVYIGPFRFIVDVHTATLLDGIDVILGTPWLASLGPVVMDFGALSMSFYKGRHVTLVGSGSVLHQPHGSRSLFLGVRSQNRNLWKLWRL